MSNHWHFVVRPKTRHQVTEFFRWLTNTHTMRWHAHHHTAGTGHLYQGRFKTFPIEENEHLLPVLRYLERNALRANLCDRAEDWRWGSMWRRDHQAELESDFLAASPINRPRTWRAHVNKPQSESELKAIRHCVRRGAPPGSEKWVRESVARMQLAHPLRPRKTLNDS
jgi:putative transposase